MVPELENYLMWTMGVGITLQARDRVQELTLISLSGAAAENSLTSCWILSTLVEEKLSVIAASCSSHQAD